MCYGGYPQAQLPTGSPVHDGSATQRPSVPPARPLSDMAPPAAVPPVMLRPRITHSVVQPSGLSSVPCSSPPIGRAEALRRARERAQHRRAQEGAGSPVAGVRASGGIPGLASPTLTPLGARPSMDFYSDDSEDEDDEDVVGSATPAPTGTAFSADAPPLPPPTSTTLRSEASAIAREKRAKALAAQHASLQP